MITVGLHPHPTSTSSHIQALRVGLEPGKDGLLLRYHLLADMNFIAIPEPAATIHTDELWQHSCFELFVADGHGPGYQEFNFSPSGAWAHYCFSDYRQPMTSNDEVRPPAIRTRVTNNALELTVQLSRLSGRMALAAVIEDDTGQLHYWALNHPSQNPDFHHSDAFALTLK